jgi:hypothetical protein
MKTALTIAAIQDEVKALAEALGWVVITHKEYDELTLFMSQHKMGGWHLAQRAAGLSTHPAQANQTDQQPPPRREG